MKSFELFGMLESFQRMLLNPALHTLDKLTVGSQMLAGLPPIQLCSGAASTHEIVAAAMKLGMKGLADVPTQSTVAQEGQEATQAAQEAPKASAEGRKGKGQKPVHQASGV